MAVVFLVGCSKTKMSEEDWLKLSGFKTEDQMFQRVGGVLKCDKGAPAWKLYTGQLFKAAAKVVNAAPPGSMAFILSAKFGLVPWEALCAMDTRIWPYDLTLRGGRMSHFQQENWAKDVSESLREAVPAGSDFVILAPPSYLERKTGSGVMWRVELPSPKSVAWPLRGLGIGKQKQKLKQMAEDEKKGGTPVAKKYQRRVSPESKRVELALERRISDQARHAIATMASNLALTMDKMIDRIEDQYLGCSAPTSQKVQAMISAAHSLGYLKTAGAPGKTKWKQTSKGASIDPCKPPPPEKPKDDPLPGCWGECGTWRRATKAQQRFGIEMQGPTAQVYGSEGQEFQVQYVLVKRSSVLASNTPAGTRVKGYRRELQARSREGAASRAQVAALAADLDPYQLLIPTSAANDGSPVVARVQKAQISKSDPDALQVVSGNGRTAAMNKVAKGPDGAKWFRAYLADAVGRWQSRPLERFVKASSSRAKQFMIVRVMNPDDLKSPWRETVGVPQDAVVLAGASQGAQSAGLTAIEAGVSQARSLGIRDVLDLGQFDWDEEITASTVRRFAAQNEKWYSEAIATASKAKRAALAGDPQGAADFINQILLGALPDDFTGSKLGEIMTRPKNRDALLGALPGMVTLDQLARNGEIFEAWRLTDKLSAAAEWVSKAGSQAISQLSRSVETESRQVDLVEDSVKTEGVDPLGVALAVVFLRASRRSNPAAAAAGYIRDYIGQAVVFNPGQAGLFGEVEEGDPAQALAEIVRFKFTKRTRKNPSSRAYFGLLADLAEAPRGLELWNDDDQDLLREGKAHREIRGTRRRAFITKLGRQALSVHRRQLPLFNPKDRPMTFTLYGEEYPDDGPHARLLAQYMAPPGKYGHPEKWNLFRDWANDRGIGAADMKAIMEAFDSGDANYVLQGPAQNFADLDKIANRLQIKVDQFRLTHPNPRLTAAERRRLPRSKCGIVRPSGYCSYPMTSPEQAADAIAMVRKWGNNVEKSQVYRHIVENFPGLAARSPIVSAWAKRKKIKIPKGNPHKEGALGERKPNPAGDLAPFIETTRVGPGIKRIINRVTGRDVLIAGSRGKWLMYANYNQPDARAELGTFRSVELAEAYVAGEQDFAPRGNPAHARTRRPPEYMLVGTRVDLVVDTGDDVRDVTLTDSTVLATDKNMKDIHLVTMGRQVETDATRKNEANWEAWTYGSDIDGRWEMKKPNGKKLREIGEITHIYYDGRLHENIDGKSRRVHKFNTPYPRLIMLDDGLKIVRGRSPNRSSYEMTSRGIVG